MCFFILGLMAIGCVAVLGYLAFEDKCNEFIENWKNDHANN